MLVMMPSVLYAQEPDREKIGLELEKEHTDTIKGLDRQIDEVEFIGGMMLPGLIQEPEGYISPEELRRAAENRAVANATSDKEEILKYVKPLKMPSWLMGALRFFFGRNVSQRPQRWDQEVVPQMGGVYDIVMPGGRPDDSWREAPPMEYDPHPDKHFRR